MRYIIVPEPVKIAAADGAEWSFKDFFLKTLVNDNRIQAEHGNMEKWKTLTKGVKEKKAGEEWALESEVWEFAKLLVTTFPNYNPAWKDDLIDLMMAVTGAKAESRTKLEEVKAAA